MADTWSWFEKVKREPQPRTRNKEPRTAPLTAFLAFVSGAFCGAVVFFLGACVGGGFWGWFFGAVTFFGLEACGWRGSGGHFDAFGGGWAGDGEVDEAFDFIDGNDAQWKFHSEGESASV